MCIGQQQIYIWPVKRKVQGWEELEWFIFRGLGDL